VHDITSNDNVKKVIARSFAIPFAIAFAICSDYPCGCPDQTTVEKLWIY